MFGIGGSEIMVIALVALLLFGPTRLPDLARSMAKAYREFLKFRQQMNDAVDDLRSDIEIDIDGDGGKDGVPKIRPPAQNRVSASGDDYLATGRDDDIVELDVPDEDDYLGPVDPAGDGGTG